MKRGIDDANSISVCQSGSIGWTFAVRESEAGWTKASVAGGRQVGFFEAWLRRPMAGRADSEWVTPLGVEAPLARSRPGYSSSGCTPAEPDSASPGARIIAQNAGGVSVRKKQEEWRWPSMARRGKTAPKPAFAIKRGKSTVGA